MLWFWYICKLQSRNRNHLKRISSSQPFACRGLNPALKDWIPWSQWNCSSKWWTACTSYKLSILWHGKLIGNRLCFSKNWSRGLLFLPEFWAKCRVSLNSSFNDPSTSRESSFQPSLSLKHWLRPADSSDHRDKAVLWEAIPCPLGSPLWSVPKWREEGHILWSKAIARKKGSVTQDPLIMARSTEIQGQGSGLCPHATFSFVRNNPLSVIAGLCVC